MWPDMVHANELQSRLIHDGMPPDRVMYVESQLGNLQLGEKFRIERTQGNLVLYPQGAGWLAVRPE